MLVRRVLRDVSSFMTATQLEGVWRLVDSRAGVRVSQPRPKVQTLYCISFTGMAVLYCPELLRVSKATVWYAPIAMAVA
jgi:hypothetical protein